MNYFDAIYRLYNIHNLILKEKTGKPEEFAEQLHISRSHLYNLIGELKDYGAKIRYCRKKQTFFYADDFNLSKLLPRLPL
jgi:predicted DNA-binding transcriptional regulator YafY